MALPSTGEISLNAVNVELGLTATAQISMNDLVVRTLFGIVSGTIGMNNGHGKSNFTPYQRKATYTVNTSWTVPSPVTSIRVKSWGASGGSQRTGATSGGGGFAQADISVTVGNTLLIAVGEGGIKQYGSGPMTVQPNGAGRGYMYNNQWSSNGGGYSGVFINNTATQGNARVIAGGGGGVYGFINSGIKGGGGGGTTGTAGSNNAGQGGTQTAGGSGYSTRGTAGTALLGGSYAGTTTGVPGGGGGWYGGGGGGGEGGGGGGSGYVNGSNTTLTTGTQGGPVANSGDIDYVAGIGNGVVNTNGQPGYVVIYY